jgi:hypothetical protein
MSELDAQRASPFAPCGLTNLTKVRSLAGGREAWTGELERPPAEATS